MLKKGLGAFKGRRCERIKVPVKRPLANARATRLQNSLNGSGVNFGCTKEGIGHALMAVRWLFAAFVARASTSASGIRPIVNARRVRDGGPSL